MENNKLERIVELYVRPVLKDHYGDIKITKVEDGVVYVKLLGQCRTCSKAQYTVEDVVAKEIKKRMPEIKDVVLDQFDEELFSIAKKILNKEIDMKQKEREWKNKRTGETDE